MYEITYNSLFELMIDVIHDSERGLPVEIVCKVKDVKDILSYILSESSFELSYLSLNSYEYKCIDDVEVSICLSCGEITVCELLIKDGLVPHSGENHIRYVSSECNNCYFKNDDCIAILKYSMEEEVNG